MDIGSDSDPQMEMLMMQLDHHSSSLGNVNHVMSPMEPFSAAPALMYNNLGSMEHASMASMREMIFRIAVMQPVHIDPESVKPPKRRNVRISKDPQSVAARHRRERISEKMRILQRLVPGGTKMDTASMLDEAIHYVKFLKKQVEQLGHNTAFPPVPASGFFSHARRCNAPAGA